MSTYLRCTCGARYENGEPTCTCEREWQIYGCALVILAAIYVALLLDIAWAYWHA